ncbi:ly6/PLAUR domain-containing protein 6B isoform X3 [Hemicordylus capensis]|uniref:ly6/PLAUR domain-containing protein 6B isoform X3 n=1 Tax=Hemicordylus capensis TaxID=884348 RepID=UPI002302D267|nr:ly6/PLAUR domain-containing protein 6B isoform X3 [Hemicordylus capensis]
MCSALDSLEEKQDIKVKEYWSMLCNYSMPLLCHMLAVAFVQILIMSGNWILAKNINFYNVRLPIDHTQYCLTVHHFTSHGRSTSVTKKCASREECHFVGCRHHRETGHRECVSCCEGMICNVDIPTNHTNAIFAVVHARRTSGSSSQAASILLLVFAIIAFLL